MVVKKYIVSVMGGKSREHPSYLARMRLSDFLRPISRPLYDYLKRYPDDYRRDLDLTEYLFRKGSDENDINLMKEAIEKLIQLQGFKRP